MTQEIKEQSIYLIRYNQGWTTYFCESGNQVELCNELDKIFNINKDCKLLEMHIHSAGENSIEYTGSSGFLYVGNNLYKKTSERNNFFLNKKRLHKHLINPLIDFFDEFYDLDDNGDLEEFFLKFDLWEHY